MKLTCKWNDFSLRISEFIKQADDILKFEHDVKSQPDFDKIKEDVEKWNVECYNCIKVSFDNEKNEFAHEFYYAREQRYNIGNKQKDFATIKKELFQDLIAKKKTLEYFLRILKVSDAIIKPDEIDLDIRSQFTTEEILDLILEKLYVLYDNNYHPIIAILEGNGIILKRHGEERELVELLKDNGYVNSMNTRDVYAQLTAQGKIYIENKHKVQSTNYNKINQSRSEIDEKIDEIIQHLQKLGLGQEIIYDELEELKDLYEKLNNKNWGQILKGKLVDLGLSQLISIDTMKMIYKELTNEVLKLT